MMSKKKWFVLLCIYVLYLLLGAAIFYIVEAEEEVKRIDEDLNLKAHAIDYINELFPARDHTYRKQKSELLKRLTNYCGKSFNTSEDELHHWDFYHSLFFVITVVTTIGYGNLAPTTMFTRIFMIFYALIGIPMNGIVMVTLGSYFGRSFTKLYHRWKLSKMRYTTAKLGLISQIVLYLIPGFTFFIFLPAGFMTFFENWAYDVAVYYCFVTLTTIGFGDIVAGVQNFNHFSKLTYWVYKLGLVIWIILGLGYVVMILGFITQALQSKKIKEIEKIIRTNIKKTPVRIREELRSLVQELLFIKVKQQAFRKEFNYTPTPVERTQSCPDLNIYRNTNSPTTARKRALSECPYHSKIFEAFNSQSDLAHLHRDSNQSEDFIQQSELLMNIVDALSVHDPSEGYEGLSDSQILASERYGSKWSIRSQTLAPPSVNPPRRRAVSDVRVPTRLEPDATWYGQEAASNYPTFLQHLPGEEDKATPNILTRLKNRFLSKTDKVDVEQQRRKSMFTPNEDQYLRQTSRGRASVLSVQQQELLEQTTIADLIRALSVVTGPDNIMSSSPPKQRKLGTACLTPPKSISPPRSRRLAIRPNVQARRSSLMPETHTVQNERRRLSLRPVDENLLAPPPYSLKPPDELARPRRFSRTLNVPSISISPVQRQLNRKNSKDDI